ncbi:hypothetical protein LCGC14_0858030 [marine sediment metagenome]|uniref:Uncharacterized protein n=1 Tax=marine sediment metagenome TaxID=412755 RepID=A0A0F9SFA5_9ZZZZ|nr:MAG: hypothetical protein Lokiarch_10220 [Candidatus Lokiarchaeum sp. GC14_75]HEC39468.1 hypothetical protein [bacterium]
MVYTIADDLIFYQFLSFVKKYTNTDLKLFNFFYEKTNGIYPEFIVSIEHFIFFFVKNENYFLSKTYLNSMRRQIANRKILIIRSEPVLINLIFNLFPDVYIHDIVLEEDDFSGLREISLHFLSFRERSIAIGRKAEYIRCVNKLFKEYIIFENKSKPIEIICKNISK